MIFISYAWINGEPDKLVLGLVEKLRTDGHDANIDVMFAQKESSIDFNQMMIENIQKAEKVIVVLSEDYKNKAEDFKGGIGTEYRLISGQINKNNKYIFVSFQDLKPDAILPFGFQNREIIYLNDNNGYNNLLLKLNDYNKYQFSTVNLKKTSPVVTEIQPYNSSNDFNYNNIYIKYIDVVCDLMNIEQFEYWTSWIFAHQPIISKELYNNLKTLNDKLLTINTSENYQFINRALKNLQIVLKDFLDLFSFRMIENKRYQTYQTEKFYKNYSYKLQPQKVEEYDKYIGLIYKMIFELTKALNYLLEVTRKYLKQNYRLSYGKVSIVYEGERKVPLYKGDNLYNQFEELNNYI